MGIEATRNGRIRRRRKNPALAKKMKEIRETNTFSERAAGFIITGAIPNNASKARYPLAPPCPTEEYKKAIKKSRNISQYSISSPFQIQEFIHREAQ
jgi:hypothetical protein